MIKPNSCVRYRGHIYSIACIINRGAYITAILKGTTNEVPLEQLTEM